MKESLDLIKRYVGWWLIATVLIIWFSLHFLGSNWTKSSFFTSASYDWLHVVSPPQTWAGEEVPLVIVYLDLPSYTAESIDPTQPWDRALHAKLLNRLTDDGASLVIFDIIFSGPSSDESADRAFQDAIEKNGKVVLAAELNLSSSSVPERTSIETSHLLLPYQPFLDAGADWGIAQHVIDGDFAVRSFFPGFPLDQKPSLTLTAANKLQAASSNASTDTSAWLRYYGPPFIIPHVSYTEALSQEALPPGFFANKVVMIGSHPMAGEFGTMTDAFRCPVSWGNDSQSMMPGVEIHATQLLNLINNDLLHRPPAWMERFILVAIPCLFIPLLLLFKPIPATMISLGAQCGLALTSVILFRVQGLWYPWVITALIQIPGALGVNVLVRSLDWYVQKRRFEKKQRAAESRIREQARLIDEAHDAILVTDPDLNILFWSRSATALYGWTETEALHRNVTKLLFAPSDANIQSMQRNLSLMERWVGNVRHRKKDGTICQVQCSCSLILGEENSPDSWIMICTDITEAKQLEEQLQKAQRLGLITNLASGMVHDLNNTLSPILLGISRLRRQLPEDSYDHLLNTMEASTQRGIDMVRQVLAFSRKEDSSHQPIDLKPLLEEFKQLLNDTFPKSIHLDFIIPNDLWNISGAPSTIHQVLLNLCINARDAMPDGGSLLIACDNATLGDIEASAMPEGRPGEYVTIIVEDTGEGMDEDQLKKIFEPFYTTKPRGKGTGLGLSSVRNILNELNAFTQVNSKPGEGTSFEIFFPRTTDTQLAAVAPQPDPSVSSEHAVLVVVEEKAVSELLAANLLQSSFQPMVVNDGIKASFLAKQPSPLHAAIIDLDIPLFNANQVVTTLRASNKTMPIILISRDASIIADAQRMHQSPTHILKKPFLVTELTTLVSSSRH
jgi:PAS domain S-box-containing protein